MNSNYNGAGGNGCRKREWNKKERRKQKEEKG